MKKILLILTILLALTACGCRHAARSSFYMDTVITWDITHVSADALIDASEAITANVETMLSLHLEASAVSGLNRGETVRHPELAELLRITKSVAEAAGGAYDVTVAPLVQLWNVAHPDTDWTPPTEDEIADLRSLVDYRQIHIESDARAMPEWSVTLDDGASIDLGGIGKGYALGKCAAMLTGKNARGTVSFGGNIAVVGQKDDGSDWRVGVKDPAAPDTLCAILEIPSGIVAVSGGYGHTVGLKTDGTVVAVGWNEDGQCEVSDWTDIIAVSAGFYHTVGLKVDGTVVAAGKYKDGQCDVYRWSDIIAISAGWDHTVGLKADGTVVAVGKDSYDRCKVSGWADVRLPANAEVRKTVTGVVNTNQLNIRENPTDNSASVGIYRKNDVVTILEVREDWGRTDLGWIPMQYVNLE